MSADPGSGTPMSERMQALLSRAVEDQLTEQRQVAGVLADVRGYLAHVASEIEALRTNPPGGVDEVERQVAAVGADVREAIRVLTDRLDAVTGLVHQRGNDLAEIRSSLEGLTEIRAALDGDLRPRVEAVDTALRDLRGAFTGIASRVADLPGRADVEGMVQRLGDPATELAQRVDRVEGWLEEMHDGLFGAEGIQAKVNTLAEPDDVEDVEEVDLVATVEETVAKAVAESETRVTAQLNLAVAAALAQSEQRVAAHVDEAVLALAEALLRRRPNRGGGGVAAALAAPATSEPIDLGSHELAAAPEAHAASEHYEAEPTEEAGYEAAYEPVYEPANIGGGDPLGGDYGDDDDAERRRRPWWRPAD